MSKKFEQLREECLRNGRLFEDPDFPAVAKSIYYSKPVSEHITWRRPKEICSNPQFIVDGQTRFDVDQGSLGNCWFIAAVAALTTKPELLEDVVPRDQSFTDRYAGIFRFYFWRFGDWKEIIIDDRLPVKYGTQLQFCRNNEEPDEFWGPLLEKAYAKLNGSYEALLSGKIQDPLVDFTGGVGEVIDIKFDTTRTPDQLFAYMETLMEMNTLMGCSLTMLGMTQVQSAENGLVYGHAYSITSIKRIQYQNKELRLIRLLNPWGKVEWKGAWYDEYSEWSKISSTVKDAIEFRAAEDGEFWMTFDDWRKNFTELQLCHLTSSSLSRRKWYLGFVHGAWIKGVNAGGCGKDQSNEAAYWSNPQFYMTLDSVDGSSNCPLIVSLMQKYRREIQGTGGIANSNKVIGYRLFRLQNLELTFVKELYPSKADVLGQNYCPYREVANEYEISPGIYCVIPTTYEVGEEAEFLLRILTQQKTELQELDSKQQFSASRTIPLMPIKDFSNSKFEESIAPCDMVDSPVFAEPLTSSKAWTLMDAPPPPLMEQKVDVNGNAEANVIRDSVDGWCSNAADAEIEEVFNTHSPGGLVDFIILQRIIIDLNKAGQLGPYRLRIGRADCRLLLNFLQYKPGRQVSLSQFIKFVQKVKSWIKSFGKYDKEDTGFLSFSNVWKALADIGLLPSNEIKSTVGLIYGGSYDGLHISDYISCTAKLLVVQLLCEDAVRENGKSFSYEQMLHNILVT